MEISLGNIIVLVDSNGNVYPKLFLKKEEAQDYARSIGGKIFENCFIQEK